MGARPLLAAFALAGLLSTLSACRATSSSGSNEPQYNIIHPDDKPPETGGVPPDKENEIKLLLQQRDAAARKCYQDVLNEKHDRAFAGTVDLLITIEPSGHPSAVKVVGGTLSDDTVKDCLVSTIKEFEFTQLEHRGDVQYTYQFRPAY